MKFKFILCFMLSILLSISCFAADKTINELTDLGEYPASVDEFALWDTSASNTKKVALSHLEGVLVSAYVISDTGDQDQGATGGSPSNWTIKGALDDLSAVTDYAVLYFSHHGSTDTVYKLDTSEDMTSYPNVYLKFMIGAYLDQVDGNETLTVYSPENIIASCDAKIFDGDIIDFVDGGAACLEWWGPVGDGVSDDKAVIQRAIDSFPAEGGTIILTSPDDYDTATDLTYSKTDLIVFVSRNGSVITGQTSAVFMRSIAESGPLTSINFAGGIGAADRHSTLKVEGNESGSSAIMGISSNQEAVLGWSNYGTGVYGIHSFAGVGGHGVVGMSNGTFGVYGWSRGDTGGITSAGVYGESVDSIGGYFYADDFTGLQGHAAVYTAGRFIRQGGPTTQVIGSGGVGKLLHDHNVNLKPVVEILKDHEPEQRANLRHDHSSTLLVNDMTDIADDDTSIGEQGLILDIRHGDDAQVGGHAKQNLDAEAVQNEAGNLVGIQCDGHGYSSGDRIVMLGTVEYDDVYTVDAATTANEIVVAATYWAEVIPATATVSLVRERKLFNIDETGVQTSRRKTYATNAMIGDTGIKYWTFCGDVDDDNQVVLPAGHGHGMASTPAEVITFVVADDGTPIKCGGSANTAIGDSDGNLCVYDVGATNAAVKNRLNDTFQVLITYWYEEEEV